MFKKSAKCSLSIFEVEIPKQHNNYWDRHDFSDEQESQNEIFCGIFLTTEQGYFLFHFSFEGKSINKHFLLAKPNFV